MSAPQNEFDRVLELVENNFTLHAQQALALARKEANRFIPVFVGTEHLLLGLIGLPECKAVEVLRKVGLNLESTRVEVEKLVGTGPDQKMEGPIPYTLRCKTVLKLAQEEGKALGHDHVGTEHLLLGLLRIRDGIAARVLSKFGINVEQVRKEIA